MATHPYQRDPQSGAGNCTCGAAEHHFRHPHTFRAGVTYRATGDGATPMRTGRCVCSRPENHPIHTKEN